MLRQTHQFRWVPISTIVEKIRVDVEFLQRLRAEERQAPLAEQRLMWNETMIRALTKQEREALKPLPSNEHVFTAEELDSLRTTGALPKSARADESSEVEIEVEKASRVEKASNGEAEAMKADEAPGARAKARASGSGSTFSPATPYGLEVELEVASDSDDCIVVAESLQMEALEPLKRRRRA